ncbi:MAG: TRAP transporter small permease [Peptococcaceae bacterium]|nr:TRAP transporter small permease [Peptococcaceae bacterium]MDH7524400.1 TRAP transporter small permease [Peptococcaceae bacterium]
MKRIVDSFYRWEEFLVKTLLALIVALVFIAAVLRTFKYPINWSVDIAQGLFAWGTFLGADVAMRKNKLMGVDLFISKMPIKTQRLLKIINYSMIIGFLSGIAFFGVKLCVENYARTFQSLSVSYSWVTLSAPVGAVLMIITSGKKIREMLNVKVKGSS